MSENVPNIQLNNGKTIPTIGLGTWESPSEEVIQAVQDAIDIGYRHIDGAYLYGNEQAVGYAINSKIDDGVINRNDIFLTSKLWNTFHHPDLVIKSLEKSLRNLNTHYLDLYLMHFPVAYREGYELLPKDDGGNTIFSDVDYLQTWTEMEKAVDHGLVKSIGVSNFNHKQLERLMDHCRIKPVTNQVECHPYLNQTKLSEFCRKHDILITAYSPLGSPKRPWAQDNEPVLLEDPVITDIASNYGKTPAQILIRYQIQRGHVVIPKSVTKSRIETNFNVFDFDITEEDINRINGMDIHKRYVTFIGSQDHRHYPFHLEY